MTGAETIDVGGEPAVERGRLEQAITELERQRSADPNNLGVHLALCEKYQQAGAWTALAGCAGRALDLIEPEDAGAIVYLAHLDLIALANAQSSLTEEYARLRPLLHAAIKWSPLPNSKVQIKNPQGFFLLCAILGDDAVLASAAFQIWLPKSVGVGLPVRIARYEKLASWCGRRQIAVREVSAPLRVNVTVDDHVWSYHADGFYLAAIPAAEILCGWDFVVAPDGTVLSDSGDRPIDSPKYQWFPHQPLPPDRVAHLWPKEAHLIDENVLFLGGPDGLFIGHWTEDFLPRLRDETLAYMPDIRIAIPKELPAKQRRLLNYFGIGAERLIECELGKRYKCRNLVVAQYGWFVRRPHPDSIRFLAEHLRKPHAQVRGGRRLFVERRSPPTRQVTNWQEAKSVLDRYGFEYIDLASMEVDEQRDKIGDAEIVIATYGSDLLASYFMQPGTDFIELRYDPYLDAVAGPMCVMADVNYHLLLGPRADKSNVVRMKKDSDFVLDCEKMNRLLSEIVGRDGRRSIERVTITFGAERSEDAQGNLGTLAYQGRAIPKF
ncbi:MAG: glycosyltransferase 61 family protein [Methyloceanibacter sp.]